MLSMESSPVGANIDIDKRATVDDDNDDSRVDSGLILDEDVEGVDDAMALHNNPYKLLQVPIYVPC